MRTQNELFGEEWYEVLTPVMETDQMGRLATRLYDEKQVEPVQQDWFRALEYTQPSKIKVVIIGQDPYINGEAHGLAFSTKNNVLTPSLSVIFQELFLEYGVRRKHTDLTEWAKQGVLLLNTILTTRYKESLAHSKWGWQYFTSAVLRHVATLQQPYVVMAWGKYAQNIVRETMIVKNIPCFLEAYHPAAESRPGPYKFTGCGHFRKANKFLEEHGVKPIIWI